MVGVYRGNEKTAVSRPYGGDGSGDAKIRVADLLPKAEVRNLSFYYGDFNALKSINMPVYDKHVTALIGPSGCGKSTFLRSFNRMHDLYPGNRYEARSASIRTT